MAKALYGINPNFNMSLLDAQQYGKLEYEYYWQAISSPNSKPDALGAAKTGSLAFLRYTAYEISCSLALLDILGDARLLDRIHELLTEAHKYLVSDWQLTPTGGKSSYWVEADRKAGKRRWVTYYTPETPTTVGGAYGTDMEGDDTWFWHATYANAAVAFKNNVTRTSPKGYSYQTMYNFMNTYLTQDFEPLWASRSTLTNGTFKLRIYRTKSVVSALRYYKSMQLTRNSTQDVDNYNFFLNWWVEGREVIALTHLMHSFKDTVVMPEFSAPASRDAGGNPGAPAAAEYVSNLGFYGCNVYNLHLMGGEQFGTDSLDRFLNSLNAVLFIDGAPATANLALDVAGGSPSTTGLATTARASVNTQAGSTYPSSTVYRRYNPDNTIGRTPRTTMILQPFALCIARIKGLGVSAHTYNQFRTAQENFSAPVFFADKAAFVLANLNSNNWSREFSDPTLPGGDDSGGTPTTPDDPTPPDEDDVETPDTGTPGGEEPEPEAPIIIPVGPEIIKEDFLRKAQSVEDVGIVVYTKDWVITENIPGGSEKNELLKVDYTVEPDGHNGGSLSANITFARFLDIFPMARIQILVNGVPVFLGKVDNPPLPNFIASAVNRRLIPLRKKSGQFIVKQNGGSIFLKAEGSGELERNANTVYMEPVSYALTGLKALAAKTLLIEKVFENVNITDIVKNIAEEFCAKHSLKYDPELIAQFDYVIVRQEFNNVFVQAALDSLATLAGSVNWGVDPYSRFYFYETSSIPTDVYTLETDDVSFNDPERNTDNVYNRIVVTGSSFGENSRELSTPYIEDALSIAKYGPLENTFSYPSAIGETGLVAFPAVILAEMIVGGNLWFQTDNFDYNRVPKAEDILPVTNEVAVRDEDAATYAQIPFQKEGYDLQGSIAVTFYFQPQFATKLLILQGTQAEELGSGEFPTNALVTSDGSGYLTANALQGQFIRGRQEGVNSVESITVYNEGKVIAKISKPGPFVEFNFPKQLVTELTVSVSRKTNSTKWYVREVGLILEGQNDLERYAKQILQYSSNEVIMANMDFPKNQVFSPPDAIELFDQNNQSAALEIEQITVTLDKGATTKGRVGKGVGSLAKFLALQQREAQANEKRNKNIATLLNRRINTVNSRVNSVVGEESLNLRERYELAKSRYGVSQGTES